MGCFLVHRKGIMTESNYPTDIDLFSINNGKPEQRMKYVQS